MIFYRGHAWALIAVIVLVLVLANRVINGNFDLLNGPVTWIGLIIGGVVVAIVGWYINVTMPNRMRARVSQLGPAGALKLTPEQVAESERVQPGLIEYTIEGSTKRNYHTLMFLPIQLWSVPMAALGVWLMMR